MESLRLDAELTVIGNIKFQIREHVSATRTRVQLIGSCTMEVADQVRACLERVAAEPTRSLDVDLSELDFIESRGLGGLVAGFVRCRRRGIDMRLIAPRPQIRRILAITRLDQILPIHDAEST